MLARSNAIRHRCAISTYDGRLSARYQRHFCNRAGSARRAGRGEGFGPSLDHRENQQRLFIPVTSIVEIAAGVGAREGGGAVRHAADLAAWLKAILAIYLDRVLILDTEAALKARALTLKARSAGTVVEFADLTVACIACARGLVVATRNIKHFAPMGIETLDPFAG
jgi:hypothetical protein